MTAEQARGLVMLLRDGFEAGSTRVEEIQRESLANVVSIVAVVPPLEAPAMLVGSLVESSIVVTHRTLRLASRGIAALADRVLATKHLG